MQVFADPLSGRAFYPGRSAPGPNISPIAQHQGGRERGGRPGGRGGGADASGSFRGTTKPPTGPTARVEQGLRRPAESPSVLAGRVQNHLHALACLFLNCSKHGERPSMADVSKAEEQLRGASDLMVELQQRLVEAQPQQYGRPAVQPRVEDDAIMTPMPGSSAAICSLSSPDNDIELMKGGMLATKKKKRRGKRGVRKGKKQMEGFAGFPLAPGLGPEFAGQPRRRLPKAPSLEIMRGEHDLSEYCLKDDGSSSSQFDSDPKGNAARDGETEGLLSLAWAEEQQRVLPADDHGNGVRDDSDDALGALGWWQGSSEHAPAAAVAAAAAAAAGAAGAANSAKGVGGWRSDEEGKERYSGEEGHEGGNGRGIEGNQEGVGCGSVFFEDGSRRPGSSLGPSAEQSRQNIDPAGRVESGRTGCSQAKPETNDVADIDSVNANTNTSDGHGFSPSHERPAVATEGTSRREGEGAAANSPTHTSVFNPGNINDSNRPPKLLNIEYARGSSTFFPATDGDDDDDHAVAGDGPWQTTSSPSPAPPAASNMTREGQLSGYGADRGMHSRRRSSGVSEEILTAGARALAEAAAAVTGAPSSAGKSQESTQHQFAGKTIGFSDNFALASEEGEKEGGQHRLGPDEATPTAGNAYAASAASAASTAVIYAGHRRHPGAWPQTVEGETTPRLYGNLEAPSPAAGVGVDERACSPGSNAEGRFGSEGPHRPALPLCSTELLSAGGVTEHKQMRSGRCASGSLLKEGCTPYGYGTPRYKATVADVQEAFERADIRVTREAAQSPRSDNGGEGSGQHNRGARGGGRGGGDVGGGGQELKLRRSGALQG
eukprot:g7895.t1